MKIGLALSGGGFRATLYQLGMIRFLRDAGILPNVSDITAVSGGSIIAAHLCLNWGRYNGSSSEFDAAAAELLSFVRLDVRNRILRRYLLGLALKLPRRLAGFSNRKLTRAYNRWAEWNGKFRDCVRKFLKGDYGQVGEMASRIVGSPDLYQTRGATASINFVTCHDGFTLADLVSYNDKHNEDNGEGNCDGANDNNSWNCGAEGPTHDSQIITLLHRQIKNALAMLL